MHNIEEALWLPAWSHHAGRWHPVVGPRPFRFAVLVLSSLLVGVCAWAARSPAGSLADYLMAGYVVTMLLNVFMPHVLGSCLLRRYMPGTATALMLNLPLGLWYLQAALAQGSVEPYLLVWAGPLTALAIAALIPLLFAIGKRF